MLSPCALCRPLFCGRGSVSFLSAIRTRRQAVQSPVSDALAHKPEGRVTNCRGHPSNLTIAALDAPILIEVLHAAQIRLSCIGEEAAASLIDSLTVLS